MRRGFNQTLRGGQKIGDFIAKNSRRKADRGMPEV
jgi:hypothetical protein